MAEACCLVTEQTCNLVDGIFRTYDEKAVSHMEIKVRTGYKFYT